ncbi:MAG: hypothetical protein HRU19_29065 [Pseudobacteriovorax sp.]|nr:hypothetical protein [Pseudobacteriovorax sp.]
MSEDLEKRKEELKKEIAETKEQIKMVRENSKAIMSGGIKSYEVETAAGRRKVDRFNVKDLFEYEKYLSRVLRDLEIELSSLEGDDDLGIDVIDFRFD